MARPLRIAFEGARYHVMNRGAAKRDIFHSDDKRYFLIELLERIHQRSRLRFMRIA